MLRKSLYLCAVVLCFVAASATAWAGLLNPGFEGGFTGGVGNSWTAYTFSGGGIVRADETVIKHSGAHSQRVTAPTAGDEGGVYQQFDTVLNQVYNVKGWTYAGVAPDGLPGAYIGFDPFGGVNPGSASILWYQAAVSNAWSQISQNVQAKAAKMTVFLDTWGTTSYFDDVPEPSSVLALMAGLAGLTGILRRRK